MENLRSTQVAILRRLIQAPMELEEMKYLNQLPLQGLFFRRMIKISPKLICSITPEGKEALNCYMDRQYKVRRNINAPIFRQGIAVVKNKIRRENKKEKWNKAFWDVYGGKVK